MLLEVFIFLQLKETILRQCSFLFSACVILGPFGLLAPLKNEDYLSSHCYCLVAAVVGSVSLMFHISCYGLADSVEYF